ncbi:unnamed protein product [Tenebrio molitor]|nr:unnamed protein product [Tenebrio molitor]
MEKAKLSEPLLLIHIAGMSPLVTNKFALIRSVSSIIIYTLTLLLLLMELFFNYKGIETLARASESLFAQYALAWKIAVFVVYKDKLARVVRKCGNLWSLEEFGERWGSHFASQHKFLKKFFRVYNVNLFVLCTQFALIPLFDEELNSVMMYYAEDEVASPAYGNFVYGLHFVYMFVAACIVGGFDCLFFYLIGHIVSEFKMLRVSFSDKDIGKSWTYRERFRRSIKHHIHILELVKDINEIYSTMLLNQHMCSLFGICFGIFLMTKDGIPPDFEHFSKYATYIFAFILQVWTYSFAGDQVIYWSSKIPDEIFYNWNGDNLTIDGSNRIIAIKRGQKAARVSLGGFGNLDIESFKFVIKNAVNFFMFMDTMYKEK